MFKRRFGLIKDFSIPARLRTAGALALFGLIVTSAAGYIGLMQSNEGLATSIASTSAVLYQKDADMLHDALRSDVLRAMMAAPWASDKERQALHSDLNQHIASFKLDMNNLEQLDLSADMKARIAAVRPTMDAYIAAAIDMTETALGDAAAAQAKLPAFNGKFTALEMQMGALGKEIQRIGNATGKAALERNLRLVNILIGAAVAGALVLIVSNLVIARSITRPLTRVRDAIREVAVGNMGGRHSAFERVSDLRDEVTEIAAYLDRLRERLHEAIAMEEAIQRRQADQQAVVSALTVGLGNLSSGDLSQPITEAFPPDYETLRDNFNATVDRLNHTITQVVQASRSIRGQSDQISHASEDLARRTENQAATLEETAAALDELTTSVRSAANSAREVEAIVQSARREAEDSGKVVLGAVDAMNGIERSSEQISQIIGVIDDIAFQTNLLALNAGVEAARAGEAGRGFAVVASEVRALAQRSSEASKEIKALISSSSHFVGRGVEAVGSAGRALTTMVERVTHISTLVSEITAGAQEQSIGLGEVNVGVTQLDQVAQKNAAMVEQSMLATQSLRNEAIGLDSLVSQFATRHAGAAEKPRLRAAG